MPLANEEFLMAYKKNILSGSKNLLPTSHNAIFLAPLTPFHCSKIA